MLTLEIMNKLLLFVSRLHWQLLLSAIVTVIFGAWVVFSDASISLLSQMTSSDYIGVVGSLASIIALFCSVSFGFVLLRVKGFIFYR